MKKAINGVADRFSTGRVMNGLTLTGILKGQVMPFCRICGRHLRNPLSVRIGIGPICRERDNKQGEFDFMHAKTQLLKDERGKYIFVRDIGHNSGRSITNDAEYVVEQLYLEYDITDETRIFYEDSEGRIDELLHTGKIFRGFKAGHEGVELEEMME
jgi:hypothetical protein